MNWGGVKILGRRGRSTVDEGRDVGLVWPVVIDHVYLAVGGDEHGHGAAGGFG